MYTVNNNTAYINGAKGIYDGKINNQSARYGRNAANNYFSYINDLKIDPLTPAIPDIKTENSANADKKTFDAKMSEIDAFIKQLDEQTSKMPPIKFEYKYSEGKKLDVISLIGASYEEMGSSYVSVKDLNKKMNATFREKSVLGQIIDKVKGFFTGQKTPKINFHPFRPKLDVGVCDFNKDKKIDLGEYATSMLIADRLSDGKIDGTITNEGENASLAYVNKKNKKAASAELRNLYEQYNLKQAQESFLTDRSNLDTCM